MSKEFVSSLLHMLNIDVTPEGMRKLGGYYVHTASDNSAIKKELWSSAFRLMAKYIIKMVTGRKKDHSCFDNEYYAFFLLDKKHL